MTRRLVVGAVLRDAQGRVLAARRTRPATLAGRWEFPGGKVEPGEGPRQALARELREELGVRVVVLAEVLNDGGCWPIDERHEMRVFHTRLDVGEPAAGDSHDELRWVEPAHLLTLDWVPADLPVARLLGGS